MGKGRGARRNGRADPVEIPHHPNDRATAEVTENSASARLVNGLSCADAMAETRPPHRPGNQGAKPGERFPNDRERANRARAAAEALFAPKPPDPEAAAATRAPAPVRREAIGAAAPKPSARHEFSALQLARIRGWMKYGMTVAQVAEVCGVPIAEIERALRQS